jgi:hypothetical protein
VAADAAVDRHVEDLLLRAEVDGVRALVPLEPREADDALERGEVLGRAELGRVALVHGRGRRVVDRSVERRRVVQVDPPVLLEVGVERDVLQALLVVLVHVELSGERLQAGVRIVQPNVALARDVQHAAVRQHGQVHRLTGRVVDDDLLELRVRRRRLSRSDRRAGPERQQAGDGNEYSRGSHAVSSSWYGCAHRVG